MKLKSFILTLFCLIGLTAYAQKSISIGYCSEQNYDSTSIHDGQDTYMCIAIPEDVAKNYVGAKLTKVRFFGAYTTAETTAFVSEVPTITEDKWATKEKFATIRKGQWNEVELTAPYIVSGKEFYIGAWVHNPSASEENNYVVPIDEGPCEQYGGYFYFKGQWIFFGDTSLNYNIMIKAVLEGDNLPAADVALTHIDVENAMAVGDKCTVNFQVKSLGTDKITKFTANYTIDGEEYSKEISYPTGINSNVPRNITLGDFSFDSKGTHSFKITLTNPNGVEDPTPSNNSAEAFVNVYDPSETYTRNVLIENFTGQTCGNCPAGHNKIHYGMENTPGLDGRAILVCHHAGYYEDTFTRPESKELTWFYASNNTYAPAYMLDRTFIENASTGNGIAAGPVHFPSSNTVVVNDLTKVMDVPALLDVKIAGKLDRDANKIEITGFGDCLFDQLAGDVRLNVWLLEDGVKANQSGASNYTHNDIFRASATGAWGAPLSLEGGKFAQTYTLDIPNYIKNLDNCWVCVFVAYNNDADYNKCQVLNSAKVTLADLQPAPEGVKDAGIVTAAAKTEVFSIDGRQLTRPEKGLNVIRTTYGNGKVESRKIFF